MAEYHNVAVSHEEGVAIATVNRPQVLNALNRETLDELLQLFRELQQDAEVRGVILTGAGDKAFVAGADISEIQAMDMLSGREFSRQGQAVFKLIEELEKPVVAAVNGFALGGGCELAMACTLRGASENARFGQPEVKLGLIPGFGGTQRLPRLIGKGRALDLLLTGRMIDATEALAIGLVNRVTEPDQLLSTAQGLLQTILKNSPLACRLCIDAVDRGLSMDLAAALSLEADLFGLTTGSNDKAEGTAAFLEKRSPDFTGR